MSTLIGLWSLSHRTAGICPRAEPITLDPVAQPSIEWRVAECPASGHAGPSPRLDVRLASNLEDHGLNAHAAGGTGRSRRPSEGQTRPPLPPWLLDCWRVESLSIFLHADRLSHGGLDVERLGRRVVGPAPVRWTPAHSTLGRDAETLGRSAQAADDDAALSALVPSARSPRPAEVEQNTCRRLRAVAAARSRSIVSMDRVRKVDPVGCDTRRS